MGKGFEGLSARHLLVLSVALNVGLFLKLAYEREVNLGTEQIFHGFCAEEEPHQREISLFSSSSMAANAEKASNYFHPSSWSASSIDELDDDGRIINLDHGDPTMYERYWQQAGDKTTVVISGWQSMSYFSDVRNLCWFLEPEFAKEVVRLHNIVGNAITEGQHIVVGTGSTQLFQAALYALSSYGANEPISIVSATPYYSFYRQVVEYMKSGLYQWVGDAASFNEDKPYIELITSPNNPDGFMRQPIVNRTGGMLVHDFAYYWPQYTPITSPADHDIMLFTVSKSTGHAGMRIGWAVVKDEDVAKRMTKFIELNSIGVSKDSQLRAAKILQAVSDSSEHGGDVEEGRNFFEVNYHLMAERWNQLREAVKQSGLFSTPEFPAAFCNYSNRTFRTQPAFAWLKCEGKIDDCESFLRGHKILTRSGKHFGVSPQYVRISMLDRDSNYHLFIKRLRGMRFNLE